MKRPLLNMIQRQEIHQKTLYGSELELALAYQHVRREALKEGGYIYWIRLRKQLIKVINGKLFGKK